MKHRSTARFALEGVEGVVVALAVLLTWPITKRWLWNWGSSSAERERSWPGDELVSPNHRTYTRGIDVIASPDRLWPWLTQIGFGRAGFYSYELLERIVGIPIRNVESVIPSLQKLVVGDEIVLHPNAPGIPVALVEEGRHICFGAVEEMRQGSKRPDPARSWSMYVEPGHGNASRFVLRGRVAPLRKPTPLKRFGVLVEEPIDFVMEQRMLRTVKRLAEGQEGR